jgi:hypothetical protein
MEASAAEPSFYMALSSLADAAWAAREYEALKKSAADAHRGHRQSLLGGRRAQQTVVGRAEVGEGESLEDFVESLRAAADDDASVGVDEAALVKLVVATNSADVSEAAMRHLASAMLAGCTSNALALKLAQTSVADLARVAGVYGDLRAHFMQRLMAALEPSLAALDRALARRTFHVDCHAAPLPGPAVSVKAVEADAKSGEPMRKRDRLLGAVTSAGGHLLGSRASSTSPLSEGAATPTETVPLSRLCQDHVFDGYVFFTLRQRLTPTALAQLLIGLAERIAATVAGLFLRTEAARKVSEWGAFALQREVHLAPETVTVLSLYPHTPALTHVSRLPLLYIKSGTGPGATDRKPRLARPLFFRRNLCYLRPGRLASHLGPAR